MTEHRVVDIDGLTAVRDHIEHHGLWDTVLSVGFPSYLWVSLNATYGDQNQGGKERLVDWANSIGATTVLDHGEGCLSVRGVLYGGQGVTVTLRHPLRAVVPHTVTLSVGELAA